MKKIFIFLGILVLLASSVFIAIAAINNQSDYVEVDRFVMNSGQSKSLQVASMGKIELIGLNSDQQYAGIMVDGNFYKANLNENVALGNHRIKLDKINIIDNHLTIRTNAEFVLERKRE